MLSMASGIGPPQRMQWPEEGRSRVGVVVLVLRLEDRLGALGVRAELGLGYFGVAA